MRTLIGAFALVLVTASIALPIQAAAQEARNLREFCAVWQGVCNRTCPAGPGQCTNDCASRRGACQATGCYHFNSPGARCFDNAEARRLTDTKYAPDPAAERARRAQRARQ
jgi:hypothetical protein